VETIEEEADFTPEKMVELEKKYHPERIIIEYNGMWKFRDLRLPWHWKVEQQITTIDASTFPMYFTNMKSMVSDMIRKSEMIIFNRCDGIEDLNTYKRNVKALNQTAEIIFEDQDGEIDEIMEEDLPYDLKADKIVLDDNTYGIWYLDSGSLCRQDDRVYRHGDEAGGIPERLLCARTYGNDLLCRGYDLPRLCVRLR